MKILIIGPLGAGKSTLAYKINKELSIPRLNLDEVSRNPIDYSYYSIEEQLNKIKNFCYINQSWVMEGSQEKLYKKLRPDLIVDMRIPLILSVWRFIVRFFKAKKLIGKDINKDLPIQAYHYRKPTIKKIIEWAKASYEINQQITKFLSTSKIKTIKCVHFKDYNNVFKQIK